MEIAKQCRLADITGHSLRIKETLHYLLKGIPFDVVKVMGLWARNAFTIYPREHALILTPFLQAMPEIFQSFSHIAIPPVR